MTKTYDYTRTGHKTLESIQVTGKGAIRREAPDLED